MRLLHNEQSMTYSRVTAVITPSNQLTCQYQREQLCYVTTSSDFFDLNQVI